MRARSWNAGFVIAMVIACAPAAKADDDDDMTTAQLIEMCSADPHSCQMEIGAGVVMGLAGACVPQSMEVPSDDQIMQVIDWLKAHPDVSPDDWSEAVNTAEATMYPCSN